MSESVFEDQKQVRFSSWWLLPLGVLLPLVTLAYEWNTRICADNLFDPLPTLGHAILVASVPLSLWLVHRASRVGGAWLGRAPWLLGWSLAIAAIYTLPFLPWLPLSVMLVIYYGFGLLPLTPLLATLTAGLMARRLSRDSRLPTGFGRRLTLGAALAVVFFLLTSAPMLMTHVGLRMADSQPGSSRSLSGIRLLRSFGDQDLMHQACFRSRPAGGILFSQQPPSIDAMRLIYYRVTGRPFSHREPQRMGMSSRWVWDEDQGSDRVGQRVAGLTLESSRFEAQLSPDPAVGYGEWLLRFANDGRQEAEARAEIELPAGGVVSRVTLWIDGEPREAAFGGRGQVREAYESVVRRQRDPLLVTTSGPDRVLVQCFPILPDGQMQIRLGITFPLQPTAAGLARAYLPSIVDRNFSLRPDLQHQLVVSGKSPWRLLGEEQERRGMTWSVQSASSGRDSGRDSGRYVEIERDPRLRSFITADPMASERYFRGALKAVDARPANSLAVVVDGSLAMRPWRDELAGLLRALDAAGLTTQLYLASDEILQPAAGADIVDWLLDQKFAGGQDPRAALALAGRQAKASGSALLWLTAPQPLRFDDAEFVWPEELPTYAVMQEPGGHPLWTDLTSPSFQVLRPTGELASVVSELPGAALDEHRWTWTAVADSSGIAPLLEAPAVASLWAKQQIDQWLAEGDDSSRSKALELAVQYRLVTPVSGAVVLETAEQYEQAGLEPPSADGIPTVPEPALVVLVSIVLLTCWLVRRGPAA